MRQVSSDNIPAVKETDCIYMTIAHRLGPSIKDVCTKGAGLLKVVTCRERGVGGRVQLNVNVCKKS